MIDTAEFQKQNRLLYRLFAENGFQHWKAYSISLVFMAMVAATTALAAWIMKDVINEVFINKNKDMVLPIALGVLTIFVVKGVASYAHVVILARIGNKIIADIQARLFNHVMRQRIDFFDSHNIGDLATRFTYSAQSAREAVNLVVTSLGRDLLSVISLVAVMVIQDPKLSVIALLIAPPAIIGVSFLVKKIKAVARAEFLSLSKVITVIQESAMGFRVVKTFGLEQTMRGDMQGAIDGVRKRSDAMIQIGATTNPLMEGLGGVAIAVMILYAGWNVIEEGSDPGAFFSFITALLLAHEPAKRLARLYVNLQAHLISVELLYNLLDHEPRIAELPEAKTLTVADGRIRLDDVRFAYGEAPALNGVTFEAAPGQTTALVGPSGGGKSTIFALIERFYDPDSGTVSIDGCPLTEVTFESLRSVMSSVSQNPFLFDGTIKYNIGLGREGATDEEIVEAAKAANAYDFIMTLPEGFEARVGEDGARLSGGQRQRLAIARAMLRDAPILLLDEATAALDAEAEARVSEALDRLMKNRTTLVIAHRLATVRHAAMIHVVDRGQIVQSGSHAALLSEGGLYAHLYGLQFASDAPAGEIKVGAEESAA